MYTEGKKYGTDLPEPDSGGLGLKSDMFAQLFSEPRTAVEQFAFKFLKRDVDRERLVVGFRFVEEGPVDGHSAALRWLNCWSSSLFLLSRHEPLPPWDPLVNTGYVSRP